MFEKLNSFTKDVSDLADHPIIDPVVMKAQFDAAPNEVREYLNKLIDVLLRTTAGDSGAKNIGATNITGLTGTDVQTILEDLTTKTYAATPNFQTPTLLNGWVANSGTYPIKYWKDADGMVHFRLAVGGGAVGINNSIMAFPAGYRPGSNEMHFGHVDNSGTGEAAIFAIATSGLVQNIRTLPSNGLVILNGSFKAVN
jgi:hypothetical protein